MYYSGFAKAAGSGNDTRSTVTCPMTPFSYSTDPIAFDIVIRFI